MLLLHSSGRVPVSAGVLLLDSASNKLYVRVRDDLLDLDEDTQEVMALLAEDLEQTAAGCGGAEALSRFEQDWSHTFRLNARESVTIHDPVQAVQQIFEEHVLEAKAPTCITEPNLRKVPVFTQADLHLARKFLPLSPAVAIKALVTLGDPNSSLEEIQKIVSTEPTIAAHLIRVANSALYSFGHEVRSVSQALLRMGTHRARLQISALMIRGAFSSPQLRRVWNHSVEVAQIARGLCNQMRFDQEEEVMLVALVHDIGQLALFGLGGPFQDRYSSLRSQGQYPLQIERELCGTSHAEIGADLLRDWLFPIDMVEAVRNHHEPSRSKTTLGLIVYLAECRSDTDEDIVNISEHAWALKEVGIMESELLAISSHPGPDLNVLCFAVSG
ncbi:MAG: HDOD domain-containing protein [Acidobacteriota bacterium]|nr:HDOD domain-containing protein [Acidobacteriota bacterium]